MGDQNDELIDLFQLTSYNFWIKKSTNQTDVIFNHQRLTERKKILTELQNG